MNDRVVSMHLNEAMVKIHDLGSYSQITIETNAGLRTANVTRSEMIEFLLDSLSLICVGNK